MYHLQHVIHRTDGSGSVVNKHFTFNSNAIKEFEKERLIACPMKEYEQGLWNIEDNDYEFRCSNEQESHIVRLDKIIWQD